MLDSTPLVARIHQMLADDIINGVYPPGQRLEEKVLAERYQVSRTPVREALRLLAARGLVEIVPRRGAITTSIGLEKLADLLEAECEIEALCARIAAQRMTSMEKKELELIHAASRDAVAAGDEIGYLDHNQQLHALINAGTHNETIRTTAERLRDRLAPFRRAQSTTEGRLALSFEEHDAIVRAILAADPEGAYRAMRDHNARLSTSVLQRLRAGQGPRPQTAPAKSEMIEGIGD